VQKRYMIYLVWGGGGGGERWLWWIGEGTQWLHPQDTTLESSKRIRHRSSGSTTSWLVRH
jgi:hypothetical protein